MRFSRHPTFCSYVRTPTVKSAHVLGNLAEFHKRLLRWYARHRRDLPWRTPPGAPSRARPNPYHVLVSEAMLQQTQVVTVVRFFKRFIRRLPTITHLAKADSQEVLKLWQGLGYYSRARNLQATANIVVNRYGSRPPSSVQQLSQLPGIGPYTAGAIASLAFGKPAAVVDGNVWRVLCRLDARAVDPRLANSRKALWRRAHQILPHRQVGEFNSALMELGATVCTKRSPACHHCPIRSHCCARARGLTDQIPRTASRGKSSVQRRCTFCIRRGSSYLIEQRPASGRWASMWQLLTLPANGRSPNMAETARMLKLRLSTPRLLARLRHDLSHRRYEFDVYLCDAHRTGRVEPRRWVSLEGLKEYPLPRPHVRIAQMLREADKQGGQR